jgi:putative transposase
MMDVQEFDAYLNRLALPAAGRRLIEKARRESPVRAVQSHIGNVICHFQSRKMDRRVELESNGLELPAAILYERIKSILEFYAQALRADVVVTDGGTQRAFRLQHTPDFLLLCERSVVIEEWRDELRLRRIAAKHPGRLERDERGWHWPEMEAHFGALGIEYCLRTPDELPRNLIENFKFLSAYYDPGSLPLTESARRAIRACFLTRASMTIRELIAAGSSTPNA